MSDNQIPGTIERINISGFKSIKKLNLELNNLNVFIGANGSGKSNFVSFFKMLQFMIETDGLKLYVARNGGAENFFHYGYLSTQEIKANMDFINKGGTNFYSMTLSKGAGDTLIFSDEKIGYSQRGRLPKNPPISLGGGHSDTRLNSIGINDSQYGKYYETIKVIKSTMRKWRFFQFHDTTPNSYIRGTSKVGDCNYLRDNGGNLAAFLYMLRDKYPNEYKMILLTVRHMAPFIEDFILEREYGGDSILLKWREFGNSNYTFSANQMSDGTLRLIALVTLLMQPNSFSTPRLICIDEPELGLHPAAIELLGSLLKQTAQHSQIIISTQSPALVDCFEVDDVVVVNRKEGESIFERLDTQKYQNWLEEYTVSELWNTNIFGGRPSK
jgi:predicted ATPase